MLPVLKIAPRNWIVVEMRMPVIVNKVLRFTEAFMLLVSDTCFQWQAHSLWRQWKAKCLATRQEKKRAGEGTAEQNEMWRKKHVQGNKDGKEKIQKEEIQRQQENSVWIQITMLFSHISRVTFGCFMACSRSNFIFTCMILLKRLSLHRIKNCNSHWMYLWFWKLQTDSFNVEK